MELFLIGGVAMLIFGKLFVFTPKNGFLKTLGMLFGLRAIIMFAMFVALVWQLDSQYQKNLNKEAAIAFTEVK